MAQSSSVFATSAARLLMQCALFAISHLATASSPAPVADKSDSIGRLVADVCKKQTVLLGEDGNHGSGKTLELKVEIVRRLVVECGFNAVYFESAIYDFIDLERSFKQGSATPEMIADAIGGIWSTTSETDPLIAFLHAQAKSGTVYLGGLDPRLGSATSTYAKSALPFELSALLEGARGKQCAFEIRRMTNWTYRDNQQYLDARAGLHSCALDMQASISRTASGDVDGVAKIMAENFLRYIELSSGDSFNKREKSMYENFVWHQSHNRDRRKAIIWCATVHAAKNLLSLGTNRRSLGSFIHALMDDNAATIGFTALGGEYGRNIQAPTALARAASDSLESRAFDSTEDDMVYLNQQQLASFGMVSARALDYAVSNIANWADIVDGMIVLRNEHPPHFVHSARPRQIRPQRP